KLYSLRELQLPQAPPSQALALQREMANLLHQQLGRSGEALSHYRAVVAAEPQDAATRDTLIAIYTKLERWRPLAELQFALSQLVAEGPVALTYALGAASLYAEKLKDPEIARQVL